jgi:hypothetical protein
MANRLGTTRDDVTVLLCSQKLQELDTRVYFTNAAEQEPSMNLDTDPVPNQSSIRYLTNGTDGIDSFPYRVQAHLRNLVSPYDTTPQLEMDTFFTNLIWG